MEYFNPTIKKTAPAPTGTVNVIAPLRRKRADKQGKEEKTR